MRHAAAHGVAVVHECAGPDVSGVGDLRDLLAAETGVAVVGYWGQAVHAAEEVAAHLVACTQAGIQAGFHVIGDAATATVLRGFALAESRSGGPAALQARGHRLEHLEMIDAGQAQALGRWAVVASVQPAFDAAWGGVARPACMPSVSVRSGPRG